MPGYNAYPVGVNPFFQGGYNAAGQYVNPISTGVTPMSPMQMRQPGPEECHYVHGIEGANAFQMPPGVTKVTLWDENNDCFYVKGYDSNGIPRVLAWNDYQPHKVEPESKKEAAQQIDMSKYVTIDDFNRMLSELTIGANGRIVRNHEHDA